MSAFVVRRIQANKDEKEVLERGQVQRKHPDMPEYNNGYQQAIADTQNAVVEAARLLRALRDHDARDLSWEAHSALLGLMEHWGAI